MSEYRTLLEQQVAISKELKAERDQLREALQEFVDRCDQGEVKSRYTYWKFKALLGERQ